MTVIKINSDNVNVTRCKDCPFCSHIEVSEYGEFTGDIYLYCALLNKAVTEEINCYSLLDDEYKTFKHKDCPVISVGVVVV